MSVPYYHDLLSDQNRIGAFRAAISDAVQPGDTVLEIGTGLGTFALFAARAGARKVFAVDADPVIHVAQAIAATNDESERIECIRGWVPEVDLPAPVDVLIFEDFGSALLNTQTYRVLKAATKKYLAPGGRMVPNRATVYVAPLTSDELRERLFPLDSVPDGYGVDWGPSIDYLKNSPRQERLPSDALAGDPQRLYSAGFPALPEPNDMGGELAWELKPQTTVHALGLWFDLELRGGGQVTNRPSASTGPWGQVVFPLHPPVVVDASGTFQAEVRNDQAADGAPGWLKWSGRSGSNFTRGHEFAAAPADLTDLADTEGKVDTEDNAPVTKGTPIALTG
ncbi:MAG: 50S ribosomal protein L11 methyltransferase [Longimicrobiales bacterium]